MTKTELVRLEGARWQILQACHIGGHVGVTETMLVHTLSSIFAAITRQWVRDQLAYLESRRLVDLQRHDIHDWRVTLTRHGWDVATYVVECEPGIARPVKYWGEESP